MESILSSPALPVAVTSRLEPWPSPHRQNFCSETHVRAGHSRFKGSNACSLSYLVKANPLSTVQKGLHSLTPPSSNLICPNSRALNSSQGMHLILYICLLSAWRPLIHASKSSSNIISFPKHFLISPGKANCNSSASFVSHILQHFFHFVLLDSLLMCLSFLQCTICLYVFLFSNVLWTVNKQIQLIHLFIPNSYHYTWYVPEIQETLSVYFEHITAFHVVFVLDSYSDTLAETTMAFCRLPVVWIVRFFSPLGSPGHWEPKSFISLQMH